MSVNTYQTSYHLLREGLRAALVDAVHSAHTGEGIGAVPCRAGATLELLLAAHRVDRRGRCRSCRRPGWLGRRRRICMVYEQAHFWLHQPFEVVLRHLAAELHVTPPSLDETDDETDPQATDVLPRISSDPSTGRLPTPAVTPSPSDFPREWRSDPDHGGVGEPCPDRPRPRRGPPRHASSPPEPGPTPPALISDAADIGARCPA